MSRRVKVKERKRARAKARPPRAGKAEKPAVAERFNWGEGDAAAVKAAMAARGMTATALAKAIGRSPARVYEITHAYPGRGPNSALRAAIVDALAEKPARPRRRAGKPRPKPHLVAGVVLAERPAEGVCPSEEEMAEEERLAAEAGHPIDAVVTEACGLAAVTRAQGEAAP